MDTSIWPAINASFNFLSASLLLAGFIFIKKKEIAPHKTCMAGALVSSTLFLISYLLYHSLHGSTKYTGEGPARAIYFFILISHTILATAIVPMVLLTATRAFKQRFESHAKIARWTWPLWMYVSITGVIIYWMLYQS